jgi:hypothetical protein
VFGPVVSQVKRSEDHGDEDDKMNEEKLTCICHGYREWTIVFEPGNGSDEKEELGILLLRENTNNTSKSQLTREQIHP